MPFVTYSLSPLNLLEERSVKHTPNEASCSKLLQEEGVNQPAPHTLILNSYFELAFSSSEPFKAERRGGDLRPPVMFPFFRRVGMVVRCNIYLSDVLQPCFSKIPPALCLLVPFFHNSFSLVPNVGVFRQ